MSDDNYIGGQCNIGREEIARRRNLGWVSLGIVFALFVALVWIGVSPWWRLFIFVPATMSASGFLQAYFHFFSGFARLGVFNFGPTGQRHEIADEGSKKKDRKRGIEITIYAALIGAAITILSIIFV